MKVIIKKLEITSFGCLKNKILNPSEGINDIVAPNESGKSTLAAFIKFIFFFCRVICHSETSFVLSLKYYYTLSITKFP